MRIRSPRGSETAATMSLFLLLIFAFGLNLSACSSSDDTTDGGGLTPPPPPEPADLSIRFSVYQLARGDEVFPLPVLLWKGAADGPDADSPQTTAMARIPAAEPFRVEWELADSTVAITGYQYRATNLPEEGDRRLPRDENDDPYWGTQQSFDYENSTPWEMITSRCDTGADCPEILLWTSDLPHSLWVFAKGEDGEETPPDRARLDWQIVNEAPTTELVIDSTYPYYRIDDGTGGVLQEHIAEGDTVPAGAEVVLRLSGDDPDPVVLKRAVLPRVRFQGRTVMNSRSDRSPRQLQTNYSSPAEEDTLSFVVGPFDYIFYGRAVDPLRAVDPSPVSFSFTAGFAPRVRSVFPSSADELLLRDPDDGTWPQNTVEYQVSADTTLYWTGVRFVTVPVSNEETWTGKIFRIPLSIEGEGDPREPSSGGYGQAKAFAYEWFGERDPDNYLHDGGGADDSTVFRDATSTNEYSLHDEEAVEVFVPALFWLHPEFFEEGTCEGQGGPDFCGVGDLLRRQLGQIHCFAWARNTSQNQLFTYYLQLVPGPTMALETEIGELGQVSAADSSVFPLQIGLDDGVGGVRIWP